MKGRSSDVTAIDELLDSTERIQRPSEAVEKRPSSPPRDEREAQCREDGRWADLVELYLQQIETTKADGEKAELLRRIGTVLYEELDDPPQALDAFVEALLLDPADGPTVIAVEALADGLSAWERVVRDLEAALGGGDEERELSLCEHLSRWTSRHLGRRDEGARYLARIRAIDPSRSVIHARLASVHREDGSFDAQRDELERALLSARRGEEERSLHLALADVHERRFSDLDAAKKHLEAAVAIDPSGRDALDELERIYRAEEKFVDLERVLEQKVHAARGGEARVTALLRLAELYEHDFVRPQRAAPRLEDALALDPESEQVLLALERCYRSMRAWRDLARVLEARADARGEPSAKIEALAQAAEVLETKLDAPDEAMRAYQRALELDDRDPRVLTELARLCVRASDWQAAAAYREQLAELELDGEAKARLLVGIGEMLATDGRDRTVARGHFARAATIHPPLLAAWEALEREARQDGELDRAAAFLEKRIEHTESPRIRAILLVQLGETRAALGEDGRAIVAYERAIVADATNEDAAERMLPHYIETGRWDEARPLCAFLLRIACRNEDADRAFELERTASRLAAALHDEGHALAAAIAAYRIRPVVGAMDDVIDACHRMQGDAAVLSSARDVLDAITSECQSLFPASLLKLAEIRHAEGERALAGALYSEVLARDGESRAALTGLAALALEGEEWARASVFKLRLARAVPGNDERFGLLDEAGTLSAMYAHDLPPAAVAFEEARSLRPRDHWVLHMLMWIYSELQQWENLVSVLRSVAELETEPALRAKAVYAAALVLRDNARDLPQAASEFERALDLDPSRLDAFERVVRIHTELRQWEALEEAYRRMLARLPREGDATLRHALLFQLGLVLRDRLGEAHDALAAFRQAARLKPADDATRRSVCELLVITEAVDKAVQVTREAIAGSPERAPLYADLYDLFLRQGAFDKAWCALDALATVGGPFTPLQERFYAEHEGARLSDVRRGLAPSSWWKGVRHAELDPSLTALFARVIPVLLRAQVLDPRRSVRLLGPPLEPTSPGARRVLSAVLLGGQILGAAIPAVHARSGPIPLATAPGGGALVASLEACDAVADRVLSFMVGERVVEQQPELAARAVFSSPSELLGLLYAVVQVVRGRAPLRAGHSMAVVDEALRRTMTEEERDGIRSLIAGAQAKGASFDVVRWMQRADASASRVGLLLAGHLETARRAMNLEPHFPGNLSPNERLSELLVFSVSDAYAELRAAFGLSIRVGGSPSS